MAKKELLHEFPLHGLFTRIWMIWFSLAGLFRVFTSTWWLFDQETNSRLIPIEKWFTLACLVFGVFYLFFLAFAWKDSWSKVWATFKSSLTLSRVLLGLLFLWYMIDCLIVNGQQSGNWVRGNEAPLYDGFVCFFILYAMAQIWKDHENVLRYTLYVYTAAVSVFMVYALINVFSLNIFSIPNGQVGMDESITLCLACNANITGIFAAVWCMLCLWVVLTEKRLWLRIPFGVFAVFHFAAVALSGSRACYLSLSFVLTVGVFMVIWNKMEGKPLARRLPISALPAVAAGVLLFFFVKEWIYILFEACTHFAELLGKDIGNAADFKNGLSGREAIWKAVLAMLTGNRQFGFFGITPIGVPNLIAIGMGSEEITVANTHNQFLEMWTALGFPGFTLYVAWLCSVCADCIRVGIAKEDRLSRGVWCLPLIVLAIVMINMMEARLLFNTYFIGELFFIVCGMVGVYAQKLKKAPLPRKNTKK